MTSPDLHVVLGASGGAGNAIARELTGAGLAVRGVNRSGHADLPSAVELLAAEIGDTASLDRAIAGAATVYMAAQPAYHRWPEEFPQMLDDVIGAVGRSGAKLVMVDNLYAYGPGHQRLTERTPHRATDAKGRTRIAMLDRLRSAIDAGDVRATIGQASDYFGPGAANSTITALAIAPTAGTGALRWMGSLDVPHSVAYLPDIARAYVTLGTRAEADGRTWILPHGAPVTGRRFLETVIDVLPEPRKTAVVSPTMLRLAAPFHRISRESLGVVYQWTNPWVADDTAFQQAFGPFATTPLRDAVGASVQSAVAASESISSHNAST